MLVDHVHLLSNQLLQELGREMWQTMMCADLRRKQEDQKRSAMKATEADMAGIERDDHLKLVERSLRPFFSGYEDLAPESKGGFVRRAPAGILAVADIDHRPGRFNVEVE